MMTKKMIVLLKTFCFLLTLTVYLTSSSLGASTQIKSDPNKRIAIPIASDAMNRIAFANDRIVQVFGDEEAYTLQVDETRGQIFLKPSEANGDKPLSITLTTEQNSVQDLELRPQKITTRTIILKGEGKNEQQGGFGNRASGFGALPRGYLGAQTFPYQSVNGQPPFHSQQVLTQDHTRQLVTVLRCVASQDEIASTSHDDMPPELKISDLNVEGIRVMNTHGFNVAVYKVTNKKDQRYEIVENIFGGQDVRAVAVEKRQLQSGESTRLFVVRLLSFEETK